ncbi:MAG: thiamine phosphate synthase [Candidatus Ancillula sp.]|nr:thiamine phosphate synthase [Candidatus Ancillula sp.]
MGYYEDYLRVYLVAGTETCLSGGHSLLEVVHSAADAGVTSIQLREKNRQGVTYDAGDFFRNAVQVSEFLRKFEHERGVRPAFFINDRVDVALSLMIAGEICDGVHIGQSDLEPALVREMFRHSGFETALVGISCRNEEVLINAAESFKRGDVNYVGTGPVHTTQSKPNMPAGLGYERWGQLRQFAKERDKDMPVVAIGGITPKDAVPLKSQGADGYCCISWITEAADPYQNARELVDAWCERPGGKNVPENEEGVQI